MISRLRSSSTIDSGGCLEMDDVVRALAVAVDRVGQPPAAPGRDLDDLAAGRGQLAGDPVDQGLALIVGQVRTEDEHQFVSAHARMTPSCGDARAEPAVPGRSRKDKDASLAWALSVTRRPDGRRARCILSIESEDPSPEILCPPIPSCCSTAIRPAAS